MTHPRMIGPSDGTRGKLEAVSRISALTHGPPETLGPGSKERKSALVNLAHGLGLTVDTSANKPELGAQIAAALDVPWDETCWSAGHTITLTGLNQLLGGAQRSIAGNRSAPSSCCSSPSSRSRASSCPPAASEVVTRISALTQSPPETLGPGSKERKSVLVNLAQGLGLTVDTSANKPDLGAQFAAALDVPWDETCWSAGHTITLAGLNLLLAGAELRIGARGRAEAGLFFAARDEALALVESLALAVPGHMDGRVCVTEMQAAQYTQWAQDEWAAFYFEFVGLPALVNAFGGGPRTFANTRFDYGLGHTWDLKVHMSTSGVVPLNDCSAIDAALAAGTGVGFLVLSGDVEYDDGEFRQWQREFRISHGKKAKERTAPPKYVRRSKPAFRPQMLEAFFIENAKSLAGALESSAVGVMRQGVQTSGRPRPPKYSMDLVRARFGDLLLGQRIL